MLYVSVFVDILHLQWRYVCFARTFLYVYIVLRRAQVRAGIHM